MELASLFLTASLAYGLPPDLLSSVCWVESRHNPKAYHSHDGDGTPSIGVCEVKKSTCGFMKVYGDLFDPKTNIECAAKYLRYQLNRYRNVRRGVCAYNRGKSTGDGNNHYTRKVFREWARRSSKSHPKHLR